MAALLLLADPDAPFTSGCFAALRLQCSDAAWLHEHIALPVYFLTPV